MNNYNTALDYFIENDVTESLICEIGLNRKSRQYDKPYFKLYEALYRVFVEDDIDSLSSVYSATKDIKIGKCGVVTYLIPLLKLQSVNFLQIIKSYIV